ncbi:hypothetical protein SIN09_11375 [Streptomyces sp. F8]|uniref:hypothetical protein n=1 Tax=unclassified Streptomyces TaxID=2593676 RepID=UPI000AE95351|nr:MULTISPECIES: hypothetical protein [unclassified Streptomyces]MDX6760026.1 hypothetical protein [Streptomyces sp. F8]
MASTRKPAVRLGAVVAGAVLLAGCGADPEAKDPPARDPVAATREACPGLLDAAAGEALQRVLQSSYLVPDDNQGVSAAVMAQAVQDMRPVPVCLATGQVGSGSRVGEIRLRPGPEGERGRGVRVMGRENARAIAFDCESPRVGATGTLRVTTTFENQWEQGSWKAELGNDYLAIAHSAARALAKELACRNGGGLPDQAAGLPAATP